MILTETRRGACGALQALIAGMMLAGCAVTPEEQAAAGERLDSNTGTTLTLMPRPVEFLNERARGPQTDPFAYLAPFETNRMGTHELFLWVTAPQIAGPLGTPQVFCADEQIQLEPLNASLSSIGLSDPPYKQPAPWSAQWYFKLSGEVLDCFASTKQMHIVVDSGSEEGPDRFNASAEALTGLADFVSRVRI